MGKETGIPILYYHSVADHEKKDPWGFLSVSVSLFKKQIDYLYKKGYYACDWKELDDHIKGVKKLPEKTVMFHFDDGFLDNWSVVFPLMKERNFKYSIVVTPEFIEKGEKLRPFVERTQQDNIHDWWGYLNEAEMKEMSDSGLVDFQAHGYTHTWYESSQRLLDIFDGTNFYPHLGWNEQPERKPYWLTSPLEVPKGYPVFEYKKSLELGKRYLVDDALKEELSKSYDQNLSKEENLKRYEALIKEYSAINSPGVFETEGEAEERLRHELKDTRFYIENITGKPVEYLVFPGGGTSKETIKICKEVGYKLISKGQELNLYGSNIYQVCRYSAVHNFPIAHEFLNVLFLQLQLKRAKGNPLVTKLFKFLRS